MIIINNEEALRIKCDEALPEEAGHIIDLLEIELKNSARLGNFGIGLAAPQIGIAKKIAIVRVGNQKIDLVNCSIKNQYDLATFKDEGCLSFPGRVEITNRFQEIHVINNLVTPNNFIVTGLMAIVCQHELDHLNSVLFMDRAVENKIIARKTKIGPNDPCACGSSKKYKRCCKI